MGAGKISKTIFEKQGTVYMVSWRVDKLNFSADVYGDGSGVVEYSNYDDAQRAVQMFDGSTFRSHQVSRIFAFEKYLFPGRVFANQIGNDFWTKILLV